MMRERYKSSQEAMSVSKFSKSFVLFVLEGLPCNNFEVEQVELFQNARLLFNVFTYFGNSLQSLAWKP